MRVLVVEDERRLVGHYSNAASSKKVMPLMPFTMVRKAQYMAETTSYDIIILDIMPS